MTIEEFQLPTDPSKNPPGRQMTPVLSRNSGRVEEVTKGLTNMKNFAITGVAGYIAPRHLKAIKDTGNNLIAAVDPHDSVGVLDQYFSDCAFFTEIERFDRHLEMLKRKGEGIDYLTICSPNHLHDAHIRLALRLGANVICEKPLVLNPWNLDALQELEKEYGKKVYTILQLRVHPALIALKKKLTASHSEPDLSGVESSKSHSESNLLGEESSTQNSKFKTKHNVVLTYITSRGPWYKYSWKGDPQKSGGIATNIGIHFFDLLIWLFGKVEKSEVHSSEENKMAGFIELENANVKWFLSIDRNDLPKEIIEKGKSTFRSIKIDNEEVEFTDGFTDLHTKVYEKTIAGEGFGIEDARNSIELVYRIKSSKIISLGQEQETHPLVLNCLNNKM